MTEDSVPVVLIAEDEPSVAEGYELWLSDRFDIRLAFDGQEALDMIDATVDVVILDRMMPAMSGAQVLGEIRQREIDCRVVMVTAVDPDFEVIEMGFDAYLTKPPDRAELIETIDTLLDRATLEAAMQEYYSLMARKGALEAQKSQDELVESEAYQDLLERIASKRAAVDARLGHLEDDIDFVNAVREIETADGTVEEPEPDGNTAHEPGEADQ